MESTTESKFQYSVALGCTSQHFTIEPFLTSIENTDFKPMKDRIREKVDRLLSEHVFVIVFPLSVFNKKTSKR